MPRSEDFVSCLSATVGVRPTAIISGAAFGVTICRGVFFIKDRGGTAIREIITATTAEITAEVIIMQQLRRERRLLLKGFAIIEERTGAI